MDIRENKWKIDRIKENISRVIVGKEHLIDLILSALIAEGNILLEDVPGTGKTVLAKALAKSLGADFCRVQFTPDLLPSNITGINYYNQTKEEVVFQKGPVFSNILLVDEINRGTPRTQAALLECMEEHQITIDGQRRKMEEPFFVIATQNPVETARTFPLLDAQSDMFLMQLSMGLPTKKEELFIMQRFLWETPLDTLDSVCTKNDLLELQNDYKYIYVHPLLMDYIAQIVQVTRLSSAVLAGISPRGTLALLRAVRAYAMVNGRDFVTPEDIKELIIPVFSHRLIFSSVFASKKETKTFLNDILNQVEIPTEDWDRLAG